MVRQLSDPLAYSYCRGWIPVPACR